MCQQASGVGPAAGSGLAGDEFKATASRVDGPSRTLGFLDNPIDIPGPLGLNTDSIHHKGVNGCGVHTKGKHEDVEIRPACIECPCSPGAFCTGLQQSGPGPNQPAVRRQFWYPTNGQTYTAPANIGLHAQVVDSNIVQTVQYFRARPASAPSPTLHGVVLTNWNTDSPFYMLWSNVPAAVTPSPPSRPTPPVSWRPPAGDHHGPDATPRSAVGLYLLPDQRLDVSGSGQPDPLCAGG